MAGRFMSVCIYKHPHMRTHLLVQAPGAAEGGVDVVGAVGGPDN